MAVLTSDGARRELPATGIVRSQLLLDLLQHADSPEEVRIPLDDSAFMLWIDHHQRRLDDPQTPWAGMGVDRMKRLLLAADVLIDDATKADMCSGLAAALEEHAPRHLADTPSAPAGAAADACMQSMHEGPAGGASGSAGACGSEATVACRSDEVFSGLSEDLSAAILELIPLHRCFTLLPAPLHPHALTAHVSSIHAHSALTLPPLPPPLFPAAAAAATTLPHLRSLSLAGHVLWPHAAALQRVLRAVPALTALSLADCGLRNTTGCGDTLATELARLQHLEVLDLSHNALADGLLGCMCVGLSQLRTLTALRLDGTVSYAAPADMQALAAAVAQLPALAAVSIGSLATQDQFSWGARFTAALTALLRALRAAPALTSLDFHFSHGMSIADTRDTAVLWETLGRLTRLRRLSIAVPVVKLSSTEKGVWERALGWGLAALTRLTELDLRMHEVVHRFAQPSYSDMVVAPLAALTALRRLRLPQFALIDREAAGAAGGAGMLCVLGLPELTSLHVRGNRGVTYTKQAAAAAASESALAAALCAAPQIRDVCMPVHMCAGDHSRTVPALVELHERAEASSDGRGGAVSTSSPLSTQSVGRLPPPAGLALQLSFYSHGDHMHEEHVQRGLLAEYVPLLRAARCLDLMAVGAQWIQPLTLSAHALCCVTSVRLSVLKSEDSNGRECTAFISQLDTLTALRELSVLLLSSDTDADPPPSDGMTTFCRKLHTLKALTALTVSVNTEGVEAVITACAAHSALTSLDLTVSGPGSPATPSSCRMPIAALGTLRSLAVTAEHIAHADGFWRGLPRLERLRSLRLLGALSVERVEELIGAVRAGLPALRELHVLAVTRVQGYCLAMADLPCVVVCSQ